VKKRLIPVVFSALILAHHITPANAMQCVTYARAATGIGLQGDAWRWWTAAKGVYDRGTRPKAGAILVFARQGHMRYGHVSVVSRVIDKRTVLVDHANWAPARSHSRGEVSHAVPVIDVSAANDWSEVRVWYRPALQFGSRVYHTDGFVYSNAAPHGVPDVSVTAAVARPDGAAQADPVVNVSVHAPQSTAEIAVSAVVQPPPASTPLATLPAQAPLSDSLSSQARIREAQMTLDKVIGGRTID
jgi:hypothetical protein